MADISLSELGKRQADLSAPLPNPLLVNPLQLLGNLARSTTGDLFFPAERLDKYRQTKAK